MTALSLLLAVKIAITAGVVISPFLFMSKAALDARAGLGAPDLTLYRLYGVAMLALVVAYAGGLIRTLAGEFPGEIVAMGLVSNAGAAGTMVATGYARVQPALTLAFAAVALGFLMAALWPGPAMTALW
ncbi:MAG: hypothetical protein AAFR47_11645 [Pseudomonadota bacterium]